MKRRLSIILIASALLCGCGVIENESADNNESTSITIDENIYFDTSDLEYTGEKKQKIAIGYMLDEGIKEAPVLTYQCYKTSSGEEMCFDGKGRLCSYKDLNRIISGSLTGNGSVSVDELVSKSKKIVGSCTGNKQLDVEVMGEENDFMVYGTDSPETVSTIKYDSDGNVLFLNISYTELKRSLDEKWLENKIQEYVEKVKIRNDTVADYEYTTRNEEIDGVLYSMVTFTFVCSDGAKFCEQIVFAS